MKQLIFIFLFTTLTFAQNDFFFYWAGDETDLTPPSTPQNLLATGGVGEIVLTWDANTDDDLSRYVLYEYSSDDSSSSSAVDSVYAGSETITRSGLTAGTIYFYWLIAVDSNQNRGFYSDVASDTAEYILLAENYKDRVIADGGSVISMDSVENAITNATTNDYLDSLSIWVGMYYGVKKDANNKATKLYSLVGTNDLVQADTSKAATYTTDSLWFNSRYYSFTEISTINSVFWVLSDWDSWADQKFLLGDDNTYNFHRSTASDGSYWDAGFAHANILNGVTRNNGAVIADPRFTPMPRIKSQTTLITAGNVTARYFTEDRESGTRYWVGSLYELMISTIPFSSTKITAIEAFLNSKYSIY